MIESGGRALQCLCDLEKVGPPRLSFANLNAIDSLDSKAHALTEFGLADAEIVSKLLNVASNQFANICHANIICSPRHEINSCIRFIFLAKLNLKG